jgi:hypothetical protein
MNKNVGFGKLCSLNCGLTSALIRLLHRKAATENCLPAVGEACTASRPETIVNQASVTTTRRAKSSSKTASDAIMAANASNDHGLGAVVLGAMPMGSVVGGRALANQQESFTEKFTFRQPSRTKPPESALWWWMAVAIFASVTAKINRS